MCKEAQELITALIDNELFDSERSSIESHLVACVRCQFVHRQEQALKRAIRMAGTSVSAPSELREKILSIPGITSQRDEAPKRWAWQAWAAKLTLRPALVLALLILALLPTVYLSLRPKEPSIPVFALETHKSVVQGTLQFVKEESQERVKERLLRSVGGQFAPMGYDLSTMGLQVAGGVAQELGGRKILVTIYKGEAPSVTCYTFLGTEKDAPENAAIFFDPDKKIHFYAFSQGGVNGVSHREGKVICILVSEMPMQTLLDLARSEAQPS